VFYTIDYEQQKLTKPIIKQVLYGNIDQTLVNSLHSLLNFEIGGLDRLVIRRV